MRNAYWITLAVVALIVGVLIGYGIWGQSAARLPEAEKEVTSFQSQVTEWKKKYEALEGNLGKVTNEKLTLEKENAALKEALEKATKKRR